MADGHLSHEAQGWATIAGGAVAVLAFLGAVVEYCRRKVLDALNAWKTGDAALSARLDAFAKTSNDDRTNLRDIISEHAKKDEAEISQLNRMSVGWHRLFQPCSRCASCR